MEDDLEDISFFIFSLHFHLLHSHYLLFNNYIYLVEDGNVNENESENKYIFHLFIFLYFLIKSRPNNKLK